MFKWFYNLSWFLQLAVGLVLFGVTAVLEAKVLAAYLDDVWLGVSVAGGLEAGKVLIAERAETLALADKLGVAIVGV